jgi:predicted GIY-YIG superfamily endonuclease
VPANRDPPASLEGSSCVYILHVTSAAAPSLPGQFYVGETESASDRLGKHRVKLGKRYRVEAVVVKAESKSAARAVETSMINALQARGVDMLGVGDSTNRNFGSVNQR